MALKKDIEKILDDKMDIEERIKLSGAKRLCLHSYRLKFNYNGENFDIFSKRVWKNFSSILK